MSFFEDLVIDRAQERPSVEGEVAIRLLYALRCCCGENKAMAISDKDEGLWVSVNAEWISLVGWTKEDMNDAEINPFHPDDFESLLLVHSTNNLAAPYRIRIRQKKHGPGIYGWYKMDSFSLIVDSHTFRCCVLERAG